MLMSASAIRLWQYAVLIEVSNENAFSHVNWKSKDLMDYKKGLWNPQESLSHFENLSNIISRN